MKRKSNEKTKYTMQQMVEYNRHAPLSFIQMAVRWQSFVYPISWFIMNFLHISGNTVTIISWVFGIASAVFYLNGYLILGGIFFIIRMLLDYSDGTVARLRNESSIFGRYLDNYSGSTVMIAIFVALSYHLNSPIPLLILILCQLHTWEYCLIDFIFKGKTRPRTQTELLIIKKGIAEPIPTRDMHFIYLMFCPVINYFFPSWGIMQIFGGIFLIILLLKVPIWFIYYSLMLKKADREVKHE